MKLVSEEYKQSMASGLRENSFARIAFGNVDVDASRDGVWQGEQQSWSETQTLDYSYNYTDTVETLELNRWILDGGNFVGLPASGSINDGYVSSVLSDRNGFFTTPPVMSRTFGQTRIFRGITVTFDTRAGEWPFQIRADFWLNGSVADSKTVEPKGTEVSVETGAGGVDRVDITFLSMMPYRYPRVECVVYGVGEVFTNADIIDLKQSSDVDPLSRRLPAEKLSFTVIDYAHRYDPDNPKGVYKYVETNSPVSLQFGYRLYNNGPVEWLKPDKYLLDGKPTVRSNRATFSATGLIGRLTGIYYKSTLGNKTLYAMAEDVLLDADLTLTETGEHPWVIDESLKTMYSTAVLPITTHMNCLQLIAHAARCRLFTDDDNIVHIQPFAVNVSGMYAGSVSDNGHMAWSETDTLETNESSAETVVTLELNRWMLDSGMNFAGLKSGVKNGYVGDALSGRTGDYSDPVPALVKEFDVPHDLPIVTVAFDTVLGEYPRQIRLLYYSFNTLKDTQEVQVTGSTVTVRSTAAENITRLEVQFVSGLPYYRARVSKLYFRESDFVLDFTSISENSQTVTKIDELKAVSVAKYGYTAESSQRSALFEGTTSETALHVEFSSIAQDVQISVSGGTLLSSSIYGRAADMTLSEGTKTVAITGITLSEHSTVITYPVSTEGETDQEENPLITNDDMAAALAEHVSAYLHLRNTYDANYRGNPELQCGDVIGLQTLYTQQMDALILCTDISFNGSLQGALKVKGLVDAGSYMPVPDPYIYTVPEQAGTLVYNGSLQTAVFSGYDPAKLEIGGVTEAKNAGTYAATFRPKDGYEWGDV